MMKIRTSAAAGILLAAATPISADAVDMAEESRSHGAHVHGSWDLFAALDGDTLSVNLTGPLVDVAGFEHTPRSHAEWETLEALASSLGGVNRLLAAPLAAACSAAGAPVITWPAGYDPALHDDHHHGDDHDHDHSHEHSHEDGETHSHAHDDDHHGDDHDHGDDHSHEHSHEDGETHSHTHDDDHHGDSHDHHAGDHDDDHDHGDHDDHESNLEVSYSFTCANVAALTSITFGGFTVFDGIKTVDAVYLSDTAQKAAALTPGSAVFSLD